ncbi:protein transport protein SEC24 [Sporothrix schenckii 1099-18]|uniref:Protein transport protein SEC24 n=1 Tax=Sporothrix schenckii 1099-18 TaxID=1397361 RepID=A0A0F2M401_SPOSC|nr:protein transport protein SEC24 [Sporothrix schenckii 1099-18]KJR83495.1 protein transport protein SEC24 [Sporothrix schenckii 1099-18]
MADYAMFHALGQGEQLDPNDPRRTTQPAAPTFVPPIAPQPYQQQQQQQQPYQQAYGQPQQGQPSYGVPPAGLGQPAYGGQAPYMGTPSPAGQGFGAPPPVAGQAAAGPGAEDGGLAAQMGGMTLGPDGHQTTRKKKKDRHAYHHVEAPVGSSMGFSAAAMSGGPVPGAPGAPGAPGVPGAPGFDNGPITPQMNQFPAAANAPFTPANPTDPASFGARGAVAEAGSVPAMVPASGHQKVSADDIPSVPLSRDSLQQHFLTNVYPTFERHVPPPAAISFVAYDQGNSSPKYTRLTMNNIPSTAEALHSTGLPLGLLVQPLAPLQAGEQPVPVLDFGESGPPRCRRCRAYINPFMVFRSGGNKFVCNLCTYPNDTPPEYFCATSPQGVRGDRDQRPELSRGTVEFVVPKEYWTKEPVGLRWLFLIDVTQESYNRGFLEAFCEGILGALYGGEDEVDDNGEPKRRIPQNARVGFVTYDKEVHFYNVASSLEQAQMMIMPDIEDPFVPLSDGLFVDPYESKAVITSLLTRLPQMFSTIKNPEPALLSTLNAAISALEATGGKVVCAVSSLSTWGPGRLFMRDDGKHTGGEMDKKLYTTEHPGWRKAAERMTSAGIGIDFFLAAPAGGYLDVATIGHVSSTTGGEAFYYPNFIAGRDNAKLSMEVKNAVTRETGFQALIKVRCSNGLQVSNYHGNFVQHTLGADLEVGSIDADKAIGVTFSYDGKLDTKLDAHFQSALLYTTADGQRRVRCSNIIASVSESTRESLKFVDQDAVYGILAKEAATKLATTSANLKDTRNWLTEKTIDILAGYRKHHASASAPPSQLIMPERLKEFCMYMLSLLKCRAFKGGSETGDRRVHELRMLRSMGALELSLYLYPRILPLHNLQPEEGFPDPETGHLRMPPAMRATFAKVEPGGVYLVDNGQQCLIWLEKQTSPNLIQDLFGEDKDKLQSLDPYMSSLPVLETHLNAQVRNMIEFLKTLRGSKGLTIQLARQGLDGAEFEFARMLVEDRNNEAQSYVDWLVHIHKGVQMELGGQKRKDESSEASSVLGSSFGGLRPAYF